MSFEKPEPLNKKEAHEEANLLRAQMKVSPETGKIIEESGERKPTIEDYENALKALKELERVAYEFVSVKEEVVDAFNQLSKMGPIFGLGFKHLLDAFKEWVDGGSFKKSLEESQWERDEQQRQLLTTPLSQVMELVIQARGELIRLQSEAKKFESPQK